jgi:hypothetical protein
MLLTARTLRRALILFWGLLIGFASPVFANNISLTGLLSPTDPNDVLLISFSLSSAQTVNLQSYGFGGSAQAPGGTNDAGAVISSGGFDSYFSLFSGAGPGATFLQSNDDGDCPPGDGTFGCSDSTINGLLAAGTYTLAVSAFENFSFAENLGGGTLGDGFIGLGNYGFNTSDYAVDITVGPDSAALTLLNVQRLSDTPSSVPEPSCLVLLSTAIVALKIRYGRQRNAGAAKEIL